MTIIAAIREIWRGKDCYRIFMNQECARYALAGAVLDLGSGVGAASYHRFFKKADAVRIHAIDRAIASIDFERDTLPYPDASMDVVLAFNIFEHIYHYAFLTGEVRRILKLDGVIFGSVPFLVGFHPDPHDYWRYTKEALDGIFREAGFRRIEVRVLGRGPFVAAFSQIEFMIPRILKMICFPLFVALDVAIFALCPRLDRHRFALGFFFRITA